MGGLLGWAPGPGQIRRAAAAALAGFASPAVAGLAALVFDVAPNANGNGRSNDEVRAAINRAGYAAPVADVTLDVHQMTCASCVARVEKALKAAVREADGVAFDVLAATLGEGAEQERR